MAIVSGVAMKYDSPSSDRGGYRLSFRPGCFDEFLRSNPLVFSFWSHDPGCVMGNTRNGGLVLHSDKGTLRADHRLPDTQTGRDVAELVKTRAAVGQSCGVGFDRENIELVPMKKDLPVIVVHKAYLQEVSIVFQGAIPGTTAHHRELQNTTARDRAGSDVEWFINHEHRARFKPVLRQVYVWWDTLNREHFSGVLKLPLIDIVSMDDTWGTCTRYVNGSARIALNQAFWDCEPVFGATTQAGRDRVAHDTLLHELIHQYLQQIGKCDDHSSRFTAEANRIGAKLGLPKVYADRSPQSAQWPHNVRPKSYYHIGEPSGGIAGAFSKASARMRLRALEGRDTAILWRQLALHTRQ